MLVSVVAEEGGGGWVGGGEERMEFGAVSLELQALSPDDILYRGVEALELGVEPCTTVVESKDMRFLPIHLRSFKVDPHLEVCLTSGKVDRSLPLAQAPVVAAEKGAVEGEAEVVDDEGEGVDDVGEDQEENGEEEEEVEDPDQQLEVVVGEGQGQVVSNLCLAEEAPDGSHQGAGERCGIHPVDSAGRTKK